MNRGDVIMMRDNINQFDQELVEDESTVGPIEFSILERVENGLAPSTDYLEEEKTVPSTPPNEGLKYSGTKEVIFVTGWINTDAIYQKYLWGFVAKMLIGLLVLLSFQYTQQNLWPVAGGFVLINLIHFIKNVVFLVIHRNSHPNIKVGLWLDLNISIGYLIYFSGFLLLMTRIISNRYLALFALPYFCFTVFILFTEEEGNFLLAQKKFQIFEALQLLLIAMKCSEVGFANWNYTLILFLGASVYLIVLSVLLTIILSCSLFGFLYRNLEVWKIKSLIWMTWYYLWSGLVYIYFIKGIIHFYRDDDIYEFNAINDYAQYRSPSFSILQVSSVFMILFAAINLIFHLAWKNEIKMYLKRIIYKDEVRKEISLRIFAKSFTFKLIQVSTTYFMRLDNAADISGQSRADNSNVETTLNEESLAKQENVSVSLNGENDCCLFCCENEPNIMIDPCGHGGVCKKCIVEYIKSDDGKCPFCKGKLEKLFVLEADNTRKQFTAKGEINFRRFL